MNQELGASDAALRSPSALTLQNLRYALAAAEHGSFRRAGEVLLLQQSTLSRCVRQLEEAIGMVVFERSSGGVRATPAGRQFLRRARLILEDVEALAARTQSTGRGEAGKLFGWVLYVTNDQESSRDSDRSFPTVSAARARNVRELARPPRTALRNGVVDIAIIPGAAALPGIENNVAVERAHSRRRCLKVIRSPSGNLCIGSICGRRRSFSAGGIRVQSCMTS